jgi:hypothetical protein
MKKKNRISDYIYEISESFTELLNMLCHDGKDHLDRKRVEPNSGVFDKDFLIKCIEVFRSGSYSRDREVVVERGCDDALLNIKGFCEVVIEDCINWDVSQNIIDSLSKIKES